MTASRVPAETWLENKGRRPCGENDKRYIQYRNGTFATDPTTGQVEPVRAGAYRWTLNDPKFPPNNPFDIRRSRKP